MIQVVLFWFLQDVLQVLMEGWAYVPDIFLFYLMFRSARNAEAEISLIWTAFLGGLLWDFRWSGLFGLSAGIYGGIIGLMCILWKRVPFTGRSHWMLAGFLAAAHGMLSLSRVFFFGVASKEVAFAFAVQLITVFPVILMLAYAFATDGEKRHVR